MKHAIGVWLVLAGFAWEAGAESLGDAARREKERRQKNKDAGIVARVVGPDEVGTSRDEPAPATPEKPAAPHTYAVHRDEALGRPETRPFERPTQEAMWRSAAQAARQRLEDAQRRYDEAMKRGPYSAGVCPRTRARYADRVLERQQQAKAELDAAKMAMAELEDGARRAGALPGWLR
jgi:hypothetical protein